MMGTESKKPWLKRNSGVINLLIISFVISITDSALSGNINLYLTLIAEL